MRSLAILIGAMLAFTPAAGQAPTVPRQCEPVPPPPVGPDVAPNSTFASDAEPPAKYRSLPKGYIKVRFGEEAIAEVCGPPPCLKVFLGCMRGDIVVLPDPYTSPDFARITRHELAHFAGWPASHGD